MKRNGGEERGMIKGATAAAALERQKKLLH
jgi:hypothetical protein